MTSFGTQSEFPDNLTLDMGQEGDYSVRSKAVWDENGPFQDFFTHIETSQSEGGAKREYPEKTTLTHPQAELGLSHMWPVWGSNLHQSQR